MDLKYKVGDKVAILIGFHKGNHGIIRATYPNDDFPYSVQVGGEIWIYKENEIREYSN